MNTSAQQETVQTITTHYIDGAFVKSHGREAMDVIRPTDGKVIGRVALGDEEDTRLAIAAAKRAFASFGRTTKEERSRYLRQLHKAASARIDDLTAVMIEEYGGVARFDQPPQHWSEIWRLIERMSTEDFRAFFIQDAEGLMHLRCGFPHLAYSFAGKQ